MEPVDKRLQMLQAAIERKDVELGAFKKIANTLTAHLDLTEVLELVAAEAVSLISDVSDVNIFLVDAGGLKFGATYDRNGTAREAFAQPREGGLTNTVRKTGEMIAVEDMTTHPLFSDAPKAWTGSIIGVPLIVRQRVIGVMNIARDLPGEFGEDELALVRMLASQAAIAISNARLHQAVSSQSYELEKLVEERTAELYRTNAELSEKITQLHQMQEQLVEQKKMASLGSLVAGVAHEINTPVGSSITAISHMRNLLEQLDERYNSGMLSRSSFVQFVENSSHTLELTISNLHRAAKLIDAFKLLSSNPDGQKLIDFDLGELISNLMITFTSRLHGRNIRCETTFPAKIPVHGYQASTVQIVTILVMNSLQHAFPEDEGGTIHISAEEDRGLIRLHYRDDGKGLNDEERRRIFEPFFTTARSRGRLGLGMSELYNLVHHLMQGKVVIDPQPGKGMACTIEFPARIADLSDD